MRRDEANAAHEAAAIRADSEGFAGICVRLWLGRRRWLGFVRGLMGPLDFEQLANAGEVLASVAFGEEAVVPDAVKAVRQDVEEKATDELVRGKAHDAAAAAAAIILVGERHFIFVDGDEPRIGDRGAMGVAGEIGQHSLGPAERRLGVDDEGALSQRAYALSESGGFSKRGQTAEESEFATTESGVQAVEEQAAERLRQRVNGKQEVGFAGDPSLAVEGDAAAGDKTMDMRVVGQRLPPGMQHGDEADLGAEAFGGEVGKRLRCRTHQQPVRDLLVLKSDRGRRGRQSEDDVKVGNRQQFGLASGEPFRSRRPLTLRAMAVSA